MSKPRGAKSLRTPHIISNNGARTILVISDQHVRPGDNNRRADWTNALIADLCFLPNELVVANLGDAADLESCCSHVAAPNSVLSTNRASVVGRNYQQDIAAHCDFQERLWAHGMKDKVDRRIYCMGNHDIRPRNIADEHSSLIGWIGTEDLRLPDWYNDVVDYDGATPSQTEVNVVVFCHFRPNKMGRAIASVNLGKAIVDRAYCSITVGHAHTFSYYTAVNAQGRRLHGLSAGVFIDPENPKFAYAGQQQKQWLSCLVLMRDVLDGNYSLEVIPFERLRANYGRI